LSTRWILVVLAIAGLALQGQLWLTDGGFRKTRDLRSAVVVQQQQNQVLRDRNVALDAEVINLKQGRAAAEERARTDLGMIGRSETFYQVIPARGDKMVADASKP
jgi:cell division protein FtsB